MTPARAPLTIEQQADLLDLLIRRCAMRDGSDARTVWLTVSKDDLDDLRHIVVRLRRIAPFEGQIRRIVEAK